MVWRYFNGLGQGSTYNIFNNLMNRLRNIALFTCILLTSGAYSWNAVGHRLIAQIAYDNLSRRSKITLNHYNRDMNDGYMSKNLVNSSVWLDSIRWRTHQYDAMHYIDIPFSRDGSSLPPMQTINAVWAVNTYKTVLSDPHSSPKQKGRALRILTHVVGDIHQPMHAVTHVSREHPMGDRGGNDVILHKNNVAKNLHAYWDKGAGLFVGKRHVGQAWIKQKARAFETRWPCDLASANLDAMHWAYESHALAVEKAYALLPAGHHYQMMAQSIVEKRIAQAGCRLAALLAEHQAYHAVH